MQEKKGLSRKEESRAREAAKTRTRWAAESRFAHSRNRQAAALETGSRIRAETEAGLRPVRARLRQVAARRGTGQSGRESAAMPRSIPR